MAEYTIRVGDGGLFRIFVQQISQNATNNTSQVRVVGRIYNQRGVRATGDISTPVTISGDGSWNTTVMIDVAANGSQTLVDRTFTITHDAEGFRRVNFTVWYGPTRTSEFGSGYSVSLGLDLTRIPKPPAVPATPPRTYTPPNTIGLTWVAPNNRGAPILEYQVQYANNSAFTSAAAVSAGTSLSKSISGLSINTRWFFRVRARNDRGWGGWSLSGYYDIPNVPSAPGAPTLVYDPPTGMTISWTSAPNGGYPLSAHQVQYSASSSFSPDIAPLAQGTSLTVNDLTVGQTWYFRVRGVNAVGWGAWSDTRSFFVITGPQVLYNGVYRDTIAYINVNGTWKTAIPYVNVNGTYKIAGG